jgi:hypothetical protein
MMDFFLLKNRNKIYLNCGEQYHLRLSFTQLIENLLKFTVYHTVQP